MRSSAPARRPRASRPRAAARSGSAGQPMAVARSVPVTGPDRRASTRRPRPCRSESANRDWRPLTPNVPTAGSGSGRPARAHPQVAVRAQAPHDGLRAVHTVAPRSSMAWFHDQPCPGGTAASASSCASRRFNGRPCHRASTRAALASITPTSRSKRERQHGPRGVGADAREVEQGVEVVGEGAAVALDDHRRALVEVPGPAVVAQPRPEGDHLGQLGCGAAVDVGEARRGTPGTSARRGRPGSAAASAR